MSARLAVEESGSGEPLVLIHGLATTRSIWSLVVPLLSRTRRVITLDVPGFGDSPPAGEGFELDAVASRIARGLARRGVGEPFDLVGHSLGAGVALTLAVNRTRLVQRLVLVAPAGLEPLPWPAPELLSLGVDGMLSARRALAALTDLPWGRRLLLGFAAADPAALAPGEARLIVEASCGASRTAPALATIVRADLRPLLRRTRAPLGAIWGAQDRTVPPRVARVITSLRPDADVVMLEAAGHVAMIERPQVFADALLGLLARLPNSATIDRRRLDTVT